MLPAPRSALRVLGAGGCFRPPCGSPPRRLARHARFLRGGRGRPGALHPPGQLPSEWESVLSGPAAASSAELLSCAGSFFVSPRPGEGTRGTPCFARPGAAPARPGPFAPELAARRSPLQAALPVLLSRCRCVVPVLEHRRSRRSLVLPPPTGFRTVPERRLQLQVTGRVSPAPEGGLSFGAWQPGAAFSSPAGEVLADIFFPEKAAPSTLKIWCLARPPSSRSLARPSGKPAASPRSAVLRRRLLSRSLLRQPPPASGFLPRGSPPGRPRPEESRALLWIRLWLKGMCGRCGLLSRPPSLSPGQRS
ncbi:uncharacterized protein [Callorhinus ursinus]|uniref:uncharacterized protein n=1 Tax=Callorhinus ursinus TaxID=34884 RepID=UPI003CD0361F